jgi:hypothetical protein
MASKTDTTAAQKARRQKIFLAVGGVLLLALAAFQLPKVFGGSSSTTSEPAAATSTPAAVQSGTAVTPAPGAVTPPGTAASPLPGATTAIRPGGTYVVGVAVSPALVPKAGAGQLWSISRFEWKDPFVQQVKEAEAAASAAQPAASPPPPASAEPDVVPGQTKAAPAAAGAPKFATIAVNGTPAAVGLKQAFPATKQFTLAALTRNSATVTIRGGSTAKGKAVALQLNQPVTLVNQKSKQRYRLQLLYVGAVPEQVTSYSP